MPDFNKTIQEALVNLPENYRQAVVNVDIAHVTENIARSHNLTNEQEDKLDKETVLLVLRLQNSVEFMEQIENRLGISESKTVGITKDVTKKILKPIQENLEDSGDESEAPKPPEKAMPGSSGYGGASDPYREPVDDES